MARLPRKTSTPAARLLSRFRSMQSTRPLPSGEKRVLAVLLIHLWFLPWALGSVHAWSQSVSLGLAAIGLAAALWAGKPETGNLKPESDPRNPRIPNLQVSGFRFQVSRLLRFPPFWIGLALLAYLLVQASNPFARYGTNGKIWWLMAIPNISWLPTSIDAPFEKFNLWRQFIIYASAWLTVCTVGIGLTRRRSFMILLGGLALNSLVLALLGFYLRAVHPFNQVLWVQNYWTRNIIPFASFTYKNDAGAYLSLMAVLWVVLAVRRHERSLREHAASSPALLYALGAGLLFTAVVFTYSRGATMILGAYLAAAALIFSLSRIFSRTESTTPRVVTFVVSGMVAFVVLFAVAQLDFGRVAKRFEALADGGKNDVSVTMRLDANQASLDMLSARWPRGVGAGGFQYLFPLYLQRYDGAYQGGKLYWEHAHCDWLEIPIELGLGGVVVIAAGGLWWLVRVIRSASWRRLVPALLVLGLGQTLIHAAFDFPYSNPAILVTWLTLAIVAVRWPAARGEEAD
jgi:hypothetical protein